MTLNDLQAYMVHEYVADYNAGHLSRRDLVRRVLNICGGLGSTATLLLALGCSQPAAQPTAAPAAASPAASPATAASPSAAASPVASPSPAAAAKPAASPAASPSASPSPVAGSPVSVPANDPTIDGQDITFSSADGATILVYHAR